MEGASRRKGEGSSMESGKVRSSNFELLRIAAMLMIVMFHIFLHWPKAQLTDMNSIDFFGNGLFNHPEFYPQLWLIHAAMPLGPVGNGLFMMLSGYFLASRERIDLARVSQKILMQLFFATVLLVIASALFDSLYNQDTGIYLALIVSGEFNNGWWFIGYYFVVIVIAALFLNKFLAGLEEKQYFTFLITLLAFVQFSWSGRLLDGLASELRTAGIGVFFYALGGFLHKYRPFKEIKTRSLLFVIALVNLFHLLSSYNVTRGNIESFVRNGGNGDFVQFIGELGNFDILVVILVVCLFEIFRRIRIPHSRIINFLGSSTFMIYLIHENAFFWSLYNIRDCITLLYDQPFLLLLEILKWTLLDFLLGVSAYTIFGILLRAVRLHTFRKSGKNPITIPKQEPIKKIYVEMLREVVEESAHEND